MKPKRLRKERKDDVLRLRITAEQKELLAEAAARENLDLSAWVRSTLLKVAAGQLVPRPLA